jgi:hypothetical protein
MMPELTPDEPVLKIFGDGGTFKGFTTYYLIEVPR